MLTFPQKQNKIDKHFEKQKSCNSMYSIRKKTKKNQWRTFPDLNQVRFELTSYHQTTLRNLNKIGRSIFEVVMKTDWEKKLLHPVS